MNNITYPKVLAIIPARGGSKGLPMKNLLLAGGKPLIAWTIEAALSVKCITRLILSSDDDEIIETARNYRCDVPFKRPVELATDSATSVKVVQHALEIIPGYDYIMLLQPTSPLRTAEDIDLAFELMLSHNAPACVSLKPVDESPYWMYKLEETGRLKSVVESAVYFQRRQDLPPAYSLNGAIYIAKIDWFLKNLAFVSEQTIGYIMPKERSLDIDTMDDFRYFLNVVGKELHE